MRRGLAAGAIDGLSREGASAAPAVSGSSLSRRWISQSSVTAPGGLMGEHRLAGGEYEGIGMDGLDAPVVRAGLHGFGDERRDAFLQCGEQHAFCSAMGSASSRLRNFGIGGRSSFNPPS